ncbi:MAG TPA: hypothetical protein DCX17_03440 [Firmicutes bacterium]|nr:hypothetical protein [Bacillota bacterium]
MVKVSIPEEIKKDRRLPVYLFAVSIILFVSMLALLFPVFQVVDLTSGIVIENVGVLDAFLGRSDGVPYEPVLFGIVSQVFTIIAALSSLAFALLLRLRRTDGLRRFSLIIISLCSNILAVIFLFLSLYQFKSINELALINLDARYHVGIVFEAIGLLVAVYIQWFFFIKIRHYIK